MKIANHLESDQFWGKYDPIGGIVVTARDVRGGLFFHGAGRGKVENPRGGAKKRINRSIPKILQNA